MKVKSLTIASIVAAIAASLCCIGPVIAVALGLSAFGLAATFESIRPYLLGLTFSFIGFAFYRAYRGQDEHSATGVCEKTGSRRAQMSFSWFGAAIVVLLAAFPNYSGALWKTFGPRFQTAIATAATTQQNSLVVLAVDDLNCGGCVAAIQSTVSRLDGIHDVKFNYNDNTASITFDSRRVIAQQIESKVKAAGVNVIAVRSNG